MHLYHAFILLWVLSHILLFQRLLITTQKLMMSNLVNRLIWGFQHESATCKVNVLAVLTSVGPNVLFLFKIRTLGARAIVQW